MDRPRSAGFTFRKYVRPRSAVSRRPAPTGTVLWLPLERQATVPAQDAFTILLLASAHPGPGHPPHRLAMNIGHGPSTPPRSANRVRVTLRSRQHRLPSQSQPRSRNGHALFASVPHLVPYPHPPLYTGPWCRVSPAAAGPHTDAALGVPAPTPGNEPARSPTRISGVYFMGLVVTLRSHFVALDPGGAVGQQPRRCAVPTAPTPHRGQPRVADDLVAIVSGRSRSAFVPHLAPYPHRRSAHPTRLLESRQHCGCRPPHRRRALDTGSQPKQRPRSLSDADFEGLFHGPGGHVTPIIGRARPWPCRRTTAPMPHRAHGPTPYRGQIRVAGDRWPSSLAAHGSCPCRTSRRTRTCRSAHPPLLLASRQRRCCRPPHRRHALRRGFRGSISRAYPYAANGPRPLSPIEGAFLIAPRHGLRVPNPRSGRSRHDPASPPTRPTALGDTVGLRPTWCHARVAGLHPRKRAPGASTWPPRDYFSDLMGTCLPSAPTQWRRRPGVGPHGRRPPRGAQLGLRALDCRNECPACAGRMPLHPLARRFASCPPLKRFCRGAHVIMLSGRSVRVRHGQSYRATPRWAVRTFVRACRPARPELSARGPRAPPGPPDARTERIPHAGSRPSESVPDPLGLAQAGQVT